MAIKFGTEGWRAVIAEEFTAGNVRIVTQAVAEHIIRHRRRGATLVVGHDTRFLSDYFAKAVCEVLAANGIRSLLTDRAVPTCAVSRAVVDRRLPAGLMVTASHNPAIYNGLKVKESYGGSATAETVASIERQLGRTAVKHLPFEEARAAGLIRTVPLLPAYLRGIAAFINLPVIRRSGLRVVVDSMHGAGDRLVERLLTGGRCCVETLRAEADPLFGGEAPEPIPAHLRRLQQAVRRSRADVGIANDGDADRLGIIGPGGRWLNPGQVMCVLLLHLAETRGASGAVVKTVSNTMMIDRMAQALGLRLFEVPVGFKHIAKLMLEENVIVGGEESGGIGLQGYLPERDGLVNGLLLLEALATRGRRLSDLMRELERRYGAWHYGRRDLHLRLPQVERLFARLQRRPPVRMAGLAVARINRLDGVKLVAPDDSWLLFRRSGTEPIVRIYAEVTRASELPRLLAFGVRLASGS